ncbi:MAG: polysaccharide ABC transporter ATP-binding protein [Phycisphaeraceae bacterium]
MTDTAIHADQLSKQYRLGSVVAAQPTLGERLYGLARSTTNRLRGKQTNTNQGEAFWALKDVSFEAERGKVFGVIGRNGAGKSTLLKILSRITEPTSGEAVIHGRVGSLLEVGTGFHPELSGRENVYLNAAILGMKRSEVSAKFDDIVAFAELEKFIDTPVKRYSSGMYVRLAFAVAAHLEPEVLLIDEVLAVGDAGFQQRCLGRMNEIAEHGRTVLFVSHDMGAVARLCDKVMLLDGGQVELISEPQQAIDRYLQLVSNWRDDPAGVFNGSLTKVMRFHELTINGVNNTKPRVVHPHQPIKLHVTGSVDRMVPNFRTTFSIFRDGVRLLTQHDTPVPTDMPAGHFQAQTEIPAYLLRPGRYTVSIGGYRDGMREYIWGTDLMDFTVSEMWSDNYDPINLGLINLPGYGSRQTEQGEAVATPNSGSFAA